MASTLNFGPQWLRTLSDSGTNVQPGQQGPSLLPPSALSSQPASHSFAPPAAYKLADHRYGREEMLALYTDKSSITVDLSDTSLMLPKPELPLALLPMSEEEQALLLQNVNSTLSMKPYGSRGGGGGVGMTSMRGGRGDSDRGRGRGRGRDEESYGRRPREPWEDGYSRGGGRSYDRGGYHGEQNGPPVGGGNNRDNISRSMSTDNWREAKANLEEEGDVRRGGGGGGGGLASGSRGWGTQRNWREPREPTDRRPPNDYDNSNRPNRYPPPEEPGRKIEYRRSRSSGSAMMDDEGGQDMLPEWSTVDAEELESGGSFDATGAFLFSKENARARKAASDIDLTGKKYPPSSADPGRGFENEPDKRDDYSGGRVPSSGGGGGTTAPGAGSSSRDKNNRQLRVNEGDNPDRGLSEATADERQTGGGRTVSGPSAAARGGNSPRNSTRNSNAPSSSTASLQNGQPGGFSTGESVPSAPAPVAAVAAFPRLPAAAAKEAAPQRTADSNAPKTVSSTGSSAAGKPQSAAGLPAAEPVSRVTSSPLADDQWFYRDPQGEVQGPFKNSEMAEWFTAGFFTMTLEIKAGANGTFTTLGDLIATCGCIPFTATNPSSLMPAALGMTGMTPPVTGQQMMLDPALQEQLKMQHQLLQQQQQMAAAAAVAQQQYLISQQLQMLHAQQQQQQLVSSGSLSSSIPGMLGMPGGALPVGVPMTASVYSGMMQTGMMPGMVGSMVRPNADTTRSGPAAQPAAAPGTRPTLNGLAEPPSIWNIDPGLQVTSQRDEQLAAAAREREEAERRRAEQERADAARRAQQEQAERQAAERQAAAAAEKRRQEEEWQKAEEQRRRAEESQRKAEEEKQRQEMERRRVAEAEDFKRKEMLRLKKEEEDRMREEQRQRDERMEWQRQEELVKRLEHERQAAAIAQREKQRMEELRAKQVTSKPAPWLNASASASASGGNNMSQIQKIESERLQAELFQAERQRMIVEEQTRQIEMIQRQNQQQALSWRERGPAPAPPPSAPSLLEIQLEQERQLAEEKNIQLQAAKSVAPDLPLGMAAVWGGTTAPLRHDGYGGGSIWDNIDTGKKTKAPPAATGAHNAQFPALPAAAAKKPAAQNKPAAKAVTKTKKAEENVQKLFETTKAKDDFTKWCEAVLQGLETSVDIPTLVEFLKDIESPYEVQDYIRNYLGESKQVQVFAQQFLEKRIKMRNAAKPKQEDGLWGPAPALNPQLSRQQQSATAGAKQQQPKPHGQQSGKQAAVASTGAGTASAAGAGGKKKKKMQKVDSSVLGFTVIADPERSNYGELDKV